MSQELLSKSLGTKKPNLSVFGFIWVQLLGLHIPQSKLGQEPYIFL